ASAARRDTRTHLPRLPRYGRRPRAALRARVDLATADPGDLLGAGRWRLVRSRMASRRQVDLGGRRTGRRARRAASGRVGANEKRGIRMSAQPQKVAELKAHNIYQRINEVRKKVWYVRKEKEVDTGRGKYKATTHDAVTALVRNHLIEHGVLIIPRLRESAVLNIGETKNGTPVIRYEAKFDIDFTNC